MKAVIRNYRPGKPEGEVIAEVSLRGRRAIVRSKDKVVAKNIRESAVWSVEEGRALSPRHGRAFIEALPTHYSGGAIRAEITEE